MVLQPHNIPAELQALAHWVNWKYEIKDGKRTKVPVNSRTLGNAMSNNPDTWGAFEIAVSKINHKDIDGKDIQGIGFVCDNNDPYCGIDLDKCRDPRTGEIETWALEIIRTVDSYTEVSPSGTGIRIFCRARLPQESRNE